MDNILSDLPVINAKQAQALKKLAEGYAAIFREWDDLMEGPDAIGGTLDRLGVLPDSGLDEVRDELLQIFQDRMMLVNALEVFEREFINPTRYESSDETYFYFRTNLQTKGYSLHRVHRVEGTYECRYYTQGTWVPDRNLSLKIREKQITSVLPLPLP